jgi:hypothetical protein
MGYSDQSEYPTGIYYHDLGFGRNLGSLLYSDNNRRFKVAGIVASNVNAATQILLVKDGSDTVFMTITLGIGETTFIKQGFESIGLRLNMVANTADVTATVFYFKD